MRVSSTQQKNSSVFLFALDRRIFYSLLGFVYLPLVPYNVHFQSSCSFIAISALHDFAFFFGSVSMLSCEKRRKKKIGLVHATRRVGYTCYVRVRRSGGPQRVKVSI